MTTAAALSRRLEKMEYCQDIETRIFLIDDIGPDGAIPHTEEQIEILKAEAVAKDPYKGIYVIDLVPRGGWMS